MIVARRKPNTACKRTGAALVEMAVVFPLLLLMILAMVEMARLGMVSQIVTTAARDGCRLAVLGGSNAATVENRVSEVLRGAGIDPPSPPCKIAPEAWQDTKASDENNFITVTVSVNYADVTWLPKFFFLDNARIAGNATLSSERQ